MSITELKKIDIIATRPNSNVVKLVVTDHLTWTDVETHSRLLQDKLNSYLDFIQSGQLNKVKTPTIPDQPEVVIAVIAQHSPPNDGRDFLAKAEAFLKGVGIGFEFELREDT